HQPMTVLFQVPAGEDHHRRKEGMGSLGGVIEHKFAIAGSQWGQAWSEFRQCDHAAQPCPRALVRLGHREGIRLERLASKDSCEGYRPSHGERICNHLADPVLSLSHSWRAPTHVAHTDSLLVSSPCMTQQPPRTYSR